MSARTHLIYYHLLHDSLYLSESDFERIHQEFPEYEYEHVKGRLIRSVPGTVLRETLSRYTKHSVTGDTALLPFFEGVLLGQVKDWPYGVHHTARIFDYKLERVPGFFFRTNDLMEANLDLMWRLNTPESGILKPYYDKRGRIIGIFIYHSPTDTTPRMLSSAGLCLGAAAILPETETRKELL